MGCIHAKPVDEVEQGQGPAAERRGKPGSSRLPATATDSITAVKDTSLSEQTQEEAGQPLDQPKVSDLKDSATQNGAHLDVAGYTNEQPSAVPPTGAIDTHAGTHGTSAALKTQEGQASSATAVDEPQAQLSPQNGTGSWRADTTAADDVPSTTADAFNSSRADTLSRVSAAAGVIQYVPEAPSSTTSSVVDARTPAVGVSCVNAITNTDALGEGIARGDTDVKYEAADRRALPAASPVVDAVGLPVAGAIPASHETTVAAADTTPVGRASSAAAAEDQAVLAEAAASDVTTAGRHAAEMVAVSEAPAAEVVAEFANSTAFAATIFVAGKTAEVLGEDATNSATNLAGPAITGAQQVAGTDVFPAEPVDAAAETGAVVTSVQGVVATAGSKDNTVASSGTDAAPDAATPQPDSCEDVVADTQSNASSPSYVAKASQDADEAADITGVAPATHVTDAASGRSAMTVPVASDSACNLPAGNNGSRESAPQQGARSSSMADGVGIAPDAAADTEVATVAVISSDPVVSVSHPPAASPPSSSKAPTTPAARWRAGSPPATTESVIPTSPEEAKRASLQAACVEVLSAKAATAEGVRSVRAVAARQNHGSGSAQSQGEVKLEADAAAPSQAARVPTVTAVAARTSSCEEAVFAATAEEHPSGLSTGASTTVNTSTTTSEPLAATVPAADAALPKPAHATTWLKSGVSFAAIAAGPAPAKLPSAGGARSLSQKPSVGLKPGDASGNQGAEAAPPAEHAGSASEATPLSGTDMPAEVVGVGPIEVRVAAVATSCAEGPQQGQLSTASNTVAATAGTNASALPPTWGRQRTFAEIVALAAAAATNSRQHTATTRGCSVGGAWPAAVRRVSSSGRTSGTTARLGSDGGLGVTSSTATECRKSAIGSLTEDALKLASAMASISATGVSVFVAPGAMHVEAVAASISAAGAVGVAPHGAPRAGGESGTPAAVGSQGNSLPGEPCCEAAITNAAAAPLVKAPAEAAFTRGVDELRLGASEAGPAGVESWGDEVEAAGGAPSATACTASVAAPVPAPALMTAPVTAFADPAQAPVPAASLARAKTWASIVKRTASGNLPEDTPAVPHRSTASRSGSPCRPTGGVARCNIPSSASVGGANGNRHPQKLTATALVAAEATFASADMATASSSQSNGGAAGLGACGGDEGDWVQATRRRSRSRAPSECSFRSHYSVGRGRGEGSGDKRGNAPRQGGRRRQ